MFSKHLIFIPTLVYTHKMMGIQLPCILQAKQIHQRSSQVPKGYLAVYVGEKQKRRHVIPVSYLNEQLFEELLSQAEKEYGFDHPVGGLTIPCQEDIFVDITSRLNELQC